MAIAGDSNDVEGEEKRSGIARRYHQEHDKEYYARPEVKAPKKN